MDIKPSESPKSEPAAGVETEPRRVGFGSEFFSHHTNSRSVVVELSPELKTVGACQIKDDPAGVMLSFPGTVKFSEVSDIGRTWTLDEVAQAFARNLGSLPLSDSMLDLLKQEAGKGLVEIGPEVSQDDSSTR